MNIISIPYSSGSFYVRPDTSLNRDSNDYFCPEEITELAAAVFIYAKAIKAGKCVSAKFAGRYYNTIGKGVQLVANNLIGDDACSWWLAHSLDNTTFLTSAEQPSGEVPTEYVEKINAAFEQASKYVSFRTGDYIAIEIEPRKIIAKGTPSYKEGEKEINIIW